MLLREKEREMRVRTAQNEADYVPLEANVHGEEATGASRAPYPLLLDYDSRELAQLLGPRGVRRVQPKQLLGDALQHV